MARDSAPFTVQDLIECYRRGVFPMADARDDERIFLVDPQERVADIIGTESDVMTRASLHPLLRPGIEAEAPNKA